MTSWSGAQPAVRGLSVRTATRSAQCAGGDAAGVRPAQRAVPGDGERLDQLGRPEVAALAGDQPLVQLEQPRLLEQVDDRVLVAAEGQRATRRRAGGGGPMPSARSRSVVGQKQTAVPLEPRAVMSSR